MTRKIPCRHIFFEMGFTEMPTNQFVESGFWVRCPESYVFKGLANWFGSTEFRHSLRSSGMDGACCSLINWARLMPPSNTLHEICKTLSMSQTRRQPAGPDPYPLRTSRTTMHISKTCGRSMKVGNTAPSDIGTLGRRRSHSGRSLSPCAGRLWLTPYQTRPADTHHFHLSGDVA